MTSRSTIVSTAPSPRRAVDRLCELADRDYNFTPIPFDEAVRDPNWRTDERTTTLRSEPPGPPMTGGPFEVARQALIDYEAADPRIVRAVYDAAVPLDGRDMVLVGRFLILRFLMGVRVGGVVDGPEETPAGIVHRFGWNYRTLEGHLEEGQMDYELTKADATGEITFRVRSYSRRGRIDNPIVRWGFRVFGRHEQTRFYDRTVDRLRTIVDQRSTFAPVSSDDATVEHPDHPIDSTE